MRKSRPRGDSRVKVFSRDLSRALRRLITAISPLRVCVQFFSFSPLLIFRELPFFFKDEAFKFRVIYFRRREERKRLSIIFPLAFSFFRAADKISRKTLILHQSYTNLNRKIFSLCFLIIFQTLVLLCFIFRFFLFTVQFNLKLILYQ